MKFPQTKDEIGFFRDGFKTYLTNVHGNLKNIEVYCSDAFYLYRKNLGVNFWELFTDEKLFLSSKQILQIHFLQIGRKTPESDASTYFRALCLLKEYVNELSKTKSDNIHQENSPKLLKNGPVKLREESHRKQRRNIPYPSQNTVYEYLSKWDNLENYVYQEQALDKLFKVTYPNNFNIEDILIKTSCLNDFYSTRIFSIFPVAKHIYGLDIDQRLINGDLSVVNDIASVEINGKIRSIYSFATKYCSRHQPIIYPIFDSYVEKILYYFRDVHNFSNFRNGDLRNYEVFVEAMNQFKIFYQLEIFSFKDLDRYLWQQGKDVFLK